MAAHIADPTRARIVVPVLCAAHTLLWTIYAVVAKGSQDIHFDMGEAVVWSQEVWFDTPKHPPMSAWLAGLWFNVFPREEWAYYLLAMGLAGFALWCAWKLTERLLPPEKRTVGLVMLTFVPFYTFHALKFNANTVMIPLWALATWTFVRSFQTRSPVWAAAAGAAAAAAMLGKYWGVFLLAGFATAVILDARREAYFRSSAPWISFAVGVLALTPHLISLADNHFDAVKYALQSHYDANWYGALLSVPRFLLGVVAFSSIPLLIVGVMTGGRGAVLKEMALPVDPDRRLAVVVTVAPVILAIVAGLLTSSHVNSIWTMAGFTLLPVVLLSSPLVKVSTRVSRVILGAAVGMPIAAIVVSPMVALAIHLRGTENSSAHYQFLAELLDEQWSTMTYQPLRLVGGNSELINGISFYVPDKPSTLDVGDPSATPWSTPERVTRDGIAFVCREDDQSCNQSVEVRTAGLNTIRKSEVTLAREHFGIEGAYKTYVMTLVPPASGVIPYFD